jgi:RHS repeat-associated protein
LYGITDSIGNYITGNKNGQGLLWSESGGNHQTSKEFDPEAGLTYFNNRWYDNLSGRWITKEPLGIDGPNPYHFNFNDPVNMYDPNGLGAEPDTPGGPPSFPPGWGPGTRAGMDHTGGDYGRWTNYVNSIPPPSGYNSRTGSAALYRMLTSMIDVGQTITDYFERCSVDNGEVDARFEYNCARLGFDSGHIATVGSYVSTAGGATYAASANATAGSTLAIGASALAPSLTMIGAGAASIWVFSHIQARLTPPTYIPSGIQGWMEYTAYGYRPNPYD